MHMKAIQADGYMVILGSQNWTGAGNNFNNNQRIILVASDFDEQTLSAVTWSNSKNVDISWFKMTPDMINGEVYINIEKFLLLTHIQVTMLIFLRAH